MEFIEALGWTELGLCKGCHSYMSLCTRCIASKKATIATLQVGADLQQNCVYILVGKTETAVEN